MEFTAKELADFLKGEIEGDPSVRVRTVAKIEEGVEGALSFLANPRYEQYIYSTGSSIVLVNKEFVAAENINATLIRVDNAYEAFASLLRFVDKLRPVKKGIHETAIIGESAQIGSDVYIGPYACIGKNSVIGKGCSVSAHVFVGDDVHIGDNTVINPGVKIYHECMIGEGCVIHAGTVIGSDGFGFAPQSDDEYMKIPQLGNVIIEARVEIGANVTIDRATMGSTIIREGVKIDNLIQIGHNVEIGENTVMAAQTGIAGSTKIGSNCMMGGQVGIAGHLKIGDGVRIGAKAGVLGDIKKDNVVLGSPAIDYKPFLKSSVIFRRLPDLKAKVEELEREIELLRKR
jgi:UDP-3-O-[3-hydroxymyristoyl] glucosamine N-acyltransferase